ncbi:MAG: methylmalonyl-CoA mutase family protein [Hyphomicrobiaceae bacterium]
MTKPANLPALNHGFPTADRDTWLGLVTKALKGADYNRRVLSKSADGLTIEPIYARRMDGAVTARIEAGTPWEIIARVDHPEGAAAAGLAVADLEGGATGLALTFADAVSARGFGVSAQCVAELDAALAGVMLDLISLKIEPGAAGRVNAALVVALIVRRGHQPASVRVNFGLDPIGVLATTGTFPAPWAEVARRLTETVVSLKARGFSGPFVTCDLRPFSEAGASEAQELGAALAAGVAYARALETNGLSVADAFNALSWTLAIDADQMMGLAKIRALRRLWSKVAAASGVASISMAIHAETAWRMLTKRDPAVNMLRATAAAFAAGTGGADSVSVLPHVNALGLPDGLSRRIARNTQLVLQEESYLWRVADPAAGSGAIEGLTEQLCAAGWSEFQQIEREGGLTASLLAGNFQGRIACVATARNKDIANRKASITGTSEFPNLTEAPAGILDVKPVQQAAAQPLRAGAALLSFDALVTALAKGGSRFDVAQPPMSALTATRLPSTRLAEPFEALRAAADSAPTRPTVFLANLGPLAEHGGRATWISNLLAAGGIAVTSNDGFTSSGDVGAAFAASGATAACICGTEQTYDVLAEATAMALKAAGARHVMLAGKPGASESVLQSAGVDQFLFAGHDILEALGMVHKAMAVGAA